MTARQIPYQGDLSNPAYLQHLKEMRIVNFIGTLVLLSILGLVAVLAGLAVNSMRNEMRDVALVTAYAGQLVGLVTTAIAYLVPSPLQNNSGQRRRHDGEQDGGGPTAPISGNNIENLTVTKEADAAAKAPQLDMGDDDNDGIPNYKDEDFEPSEKVERGGEDNLDPAYFEDEDGDGIPNHEDPDYKGAKADASN